MIEIRGAGSDDTRTREEEEEFKRTERQKNIKKSPRGVQTQKLC